MEFSQCLIFELFIYLFIRLCVADEIMSFSNAPGSEGKAGQSGAEAGQAPSHVSLLPSFLSSSFLPSLLPSFLPSLAISFPSHLESQMEFSFPLNLLNFKQFVGLSLLFLFLHI